MRELPGMETTRRLYCFIKHYFAAHKISPTQREMADGCYVSAGTITRHLDRLEMYGYIERDPGLPRSVRLTDADAADMDCENADPAYGMYSIICACRCSPIKRIFVLI